MNTKHHQLQTRRFPHSAAKTICLFTAALIFCGLAVSEARGQEVDVRISTEFYGSSAPGVRVTIGPRSVTTDNKGLALVKLPLGTYTAKVDGPCPVTQIVVSTNIVKTGPASEPTLTFQVAQYQGGYAVSFLMSCNAPPPTSGMTRVKIATTASCSDKANEPFKVQAGVSISIGGKSYTSNDKGVIEIDLPPGKYPISAAWQDYGLGFVKQNGIKVKTDEVGTPVVTLGDKTETLEVRMFTCGSDGREKARAVITEMGTLLDGSPNIYIIRSQAKGRGFVGMQLRDGDTVKISGKAKLKWLDGKGTISFEQSATIVIGPGNAPSGTTAAWSPNSLDVIQGMGSFFFPKEEHDYDEQGNIIKFKASSNAIRLHIKGTKFSFGHDEQTQISTVVVQEGVVEIMPKYPGQKPFELRAGQRAEISPNGITGTGTAPAQSGPTIKTKKPVFAPNETIEVEYVNPAGHEWDLITIARPSDGDQSNVGSGLGSKKWESYTGKERSGTKTFEGLAEGQYEARYISWDGGNNRTTARVSFTVGNAPPPPPPPIGEPTPPSIEQPPATGASSDLSGFWLDDTGGGAVYRVRQVGNKVYWTVDATSKGEYVNVFHGEISGNMIDGEWLDMPGSPLRPALVAATLGLRIESNDRLVKVRSGNHYPAQVWTRQSATSASATASGTKCAEGNPQKTVTIEVPANRAWTPTGVALNPCIQVMVEASGMIEAAAASEPRGYYHGVPPAGRGQFHADKPYQLLTTLSMVGRIGDGPVVPVGTFARWWAGPPYGSGELFLGINDDGLADNSGAWKVRITTFGAAAPASGLIQKVLPGGAQPARNREVPKVEEIPETVIKPAENTGTTNRTGNRGTVQPQVEEIPEVAIRNPANPGNVNRPGNTGSRAPQVEEIPETAVKTSPRGGNVNQPGNRRKPEVEEIPEIAVNQPHVAGNTDRTRNRGTGQQQVEEIPEVAVKPNRPGTQGGRSDHTNTTPTGGENQPGVQQPPTQRQPTGERWTLVSVTVNPETPPQGWRYNAQSSSAQFTVYQGDQAAYQWSPPPQEIDSSGFTISLGVQGKPIPNSRVAATIGVSGSGLTTDTPSDQQGANVVAETTSGTSAQQSVTFKPTPGASEIEVRISMHWAITFTYKYRRAE